MHIIHARNVNQALSEGLWYLSHHGVRQESRNGPVLVAPGPVVTIYQRPQERVLFNMVRNANPFFHLMESLWMLAGNNDVEFVRFFNARFSEYSDDGRTVWGAYGYRWRQHFGYDQLHYVIQELKENPQSRRVVLGMWDPGEDLGRASKDVPCNTTIYFEARGGVLNMTVCNRSNDIIWGAYGANAVHMSVLQEYVAHAVGIPVGLYYQFSNNYHLYTEHYDIDDYNLRYVDDRYRVDIVKPSPLIHTDAVTWMKDLKRFVNLHAKEVTFYVDEFFAGTAVPMFNAWVARKHGKANGLEQALQIQSDDWRMACLDWINRAEERKKNLPI